MSLATQTALIGEEDWSICLRADFGTVPRELTHQSYVTKLT